MLHARQFYNQTTAQAVRMRPFLVPGSEGYSWVEEENMRGDTATEDASLDEGKVIFGVY